MPPPPAEPLRTVAGEWGRLGLIGFGGPPTHIVLLRQLCVGRRGWIPADEFEDAIAACNLLPGPSSTQLAIYCAGRVGGWRGALAGGARSGAAVVDAGRRARRDGRAGPPTRRRAPPRPPLPGRTSSSRSWPVAGRRC